ncbi:uncharacterized protein F09G8.5 isoform X2 [Pieris rapae]|uniref:uncharacterized protein F09G8.5 isoform X2 n=1 Tax=Pieris rapae TaxID=64459 RepID=UPI001E280967|nr:uncharacterized protein F09G8.5 isoform X2 [Pieris rapae]
MGCRLTEHMVIARSKFSDLTAIKHLNCWGADVGDVSVLRKMPNVEVLALSLNKIRTLVDFSCCHQLRKLSVRKNDIQDLAEIRHLKHLPNLTNLWLDENPCASHAEYRMTVLRNLPNLEKLDNVPVTPEEVQEAMKRGILIPESGSDDEVCPQEQRHNRYLTARSFESSPERVRQPQYAGELFPPSHRRVASPVNERYLHPAMTTSHYEPRTTRSTEAPSLKRSVSTNSIKDFSCSSSTGDWRQYDAPAQDCYERASDRSDTHSFREWERDETGEVERGINPGTREYPSAVMDGRRGVARRPVTMNSNLLSAVLCLVKELDYASLEVVEMAVRSRMDELANSQ